MARRAYGAHRTMTPEMKARNVGESILRHDAEGIPWTWSQFGLTEDSPQGALVRQWLAVHHPEEWRQS